MADIFNMLDTWNASGTTFTAIKMSVTDTASAAGSLLMDLQVGGVSQFSVRKNGTSALSSILVGGGTFGGDANWWSSNNLNVASASVLSFGPADTVLRRDAANTLAQRNGVNAQAFNLYNTYTDASNYERGYMRWSSNLLDIGMEAAGTGSAGRIIRFVNTTEIFRLSSTVAEFKRPIYMGGATSGTIDFIEQSSPPSGQANLAKIFAEDNGSGKTRLMVQFGSGAAQQIAIEP